MTSYTFCALMANYNDASTLEAALTPIIGQTVPFDRIVVINDGSTDNSLEVLEKLKARAPMLEVVDNARNLGVMASVRIGLERSREDYVFPASANDLFSDRLVEYARAALASASGAGSIGPVGMIAGKLCRRDVPTGNEQVVGLPFPDDRVSLCDPEHYRRLVAKRHLSVLGGATFIHRACALELGGYREEMKWMSDWFLFAMLAHRHGFVYVPEVFGTMMIHPGQYSHAIYDWDKQGPVIHDFFRIMQEEFPEDLKAFRDIGLLPSYDLQTLPILLCNPVLRGYITPLLLWRLCFYKPARAIARALLPRPVFDAMRRFIRL